MRVTRMAIDLAKNTFQLHGTDESGKVFLRKKLSRTELGSFMAQHVPCEVSMEACGGSHYWARTFKSQGHSVKLLPAQHVKPFVKSRQKNDRNDSEAISEASRRPGIKLVAAKELWQQDLLSLHRFRQHLVTSRTATINQCRGLLLEYGIVMKEGVSSFFKELPLILEDGENELTSSMRDLARTLERMIKDLTEKLNEVELKLKSLSQTQPDYERLLHVPGVGPLVASLFISTIGDPKVFKNGRNVSAWLGLVPRQNSSGGKSKLLGITKTGDENLRVALIHGARSLILAALKKKKSDPLSQWILNLYQKKGWNITSVAIANRNCRVMWHLMNYQEEYKLVA